MAIVLISLVAFTSVCRIRLHYRAYHDNFPSQAFVARLNVLSTNDVYFYV